MKPIVVHKYGGSSLATLDRIRAVAQRIADTVTGGHRVVAVLSAMAGTTDQLLGQAKRLSPSPDPRELDMLMSVGERISTALLAIALNELGHRAVSFTGSQSGIITNTRHNRARIIEVRPYRLMDELDAGSVVIVAGYQGVSYTREITTLGRGGTDTTAVALAAALDAECCEIYSDVDGVYTADPRVVPNAERLDALSSDEMVALARSGAKVLNQDCVEYASRHGVAIFAKSTFGPRDDSGTVVRKNPGVAPCPVTAIAHRSEIAEITTAPGVSAPEFLKILRADGITPSLAEGGGTAPRIWTVAMENAHRLDGAEGALHAVWGDKVTVRRDLGSVTVVGTGLGEESGVLDAALSLAPDAPMSLNPLALTLRLPSAEVPEMVRALHRELIETPAI